MNKSIIIGWLMSLGAACAEVSSVLLKPTLVTAKRASKTSTQNRLTTLKPADLWSYSTVSDALKRLPGLIIVGDAGRVSSVFTKGTQSHHTAVFLDGLPVHDPSSINGAVDFSQLPAHEHLTIAVQSGAAASLYTASAIGGVITLDTQPAKAQSATTALIEGGNNQTIKTSLSTQGIKGRVNYVLHAAAHHSGGMNSVPPILQGSSPTRSLNSPFDHQDLHARMSYALNDYAALTLFSHYHTSNSQFRRPVYEDHQAIEHHHHRLQFSSHYPSASWQHEAGIGVSRQEQRHFSPITGRQDHTIGTRLYANWRQTYTWSASHESAVSLTGLHESFLNKNPWTRGDVTTVGMGGMHRWRLNSWLTVEAGARAEKSSQYRVPFTYHLNAALTPTPQWTIMAQLSKAYSPPTLYQTHVDLPFFKAAPFLKPETAHHIEVGARYVTQNQQLTLGSTWFYTAIQDLITPNAAFTTLVNLKNVRIAGLLSFIEWTPTPAHSVLLTHTYTDAKDTQTRQPLLRRPRHHLCLTLGYAKEAWKVEVMGTVLGARADAHPVTFERVLNKATFLLGARLSYQISPHFNVYTRVENLTHRTYENPLGYRAPGFSWRIGLQGKF